MHPKAKFRLSSTVDGDTTSILISGPIDESAQFGEVRSEGTVKIDLGGVTRMNSVGTRAWCLWIQRFRPPVVVILSNCPAIMVKSFGSIKGFITDHCRVYSFEVPFYSPKTGERKDFLAIWGQNFTSSANMSIPPFKDSEGNLMEMDVDPRTYFAFLKK